MSENIILSYDDSCLYYSDLSLLSPGNWLNDKLIDFYFQYLNNTLNIHNNICFINCSTVFMLNICDVVTFKEIISPLNLTKDKLIIFPINNNQNIESVGGSHWSVLIFDPKQGFYHLDSYNSMNYSFAKKAVNVFCEILNVKSSLTSMNTPQQINSYDCGVYVLCNVEICIHEYLKNDYSYNEEELFKNITPSYVTEKRVKLRNLIRDLGKNCT